VLESRARFTKRFFNFFELVRGLMPKWLQKVNHYCNDNILTTLIGNKRDLKANRGVPTGVTRSLV
jgi:GTPase SAR1 family protein